MKKSEVKNRVRELRLESELTQKELAQKVGVIRRTVLNWERGYCRINPQHTEILAQLFNVSVSYLLGMNSERDSDIETLNEWVQYNLLDDRLPSRKLDNT